MERLTMTEDELELIYEREMDLLDEQLINGDLTQEDYDLAVTDLNEMWIDETMRNGKKS
jgi:hypothetical protein